MACAKTSLRAKCGPWAPATRRSRPSWPAATASGPAPPGAYGWSLKEAATRVNAHSGEVGLDPGGIAAMTAAHLCEHENWPGHGPEPSGRLPTPYLLALLAAVYGCDLIDLADREHLPPADLLILDKYSHTQDGAGRQAAAGTASQPVNSPPASAEAQRQMPLAK